MKKTASAPSRPVWTSGLRRTAGQRKGVNKMGRTFTHKPKSKSVREFFAESFDQDENGRSGKVIDCHSTFHEAYMAYEYKENGSSRVIGLVCLLSYRPRDHFNFGYKDMDECMGPGVSNCPERILDLLTPTDSEYANNWRNRCRENIAKKTGIKKLKVGDVLTFERALSFNTGDELKKFEVISVKPLGFTAITESGNGFGRFKLRRQTLEYEKYTVER